MFKREEFHLPPWQRLGFIGRFARFIFIQLILFAVVGTIVTFDEKYVQNETAVRSSCLKECQEMHFPHLSCDAVTDMSITYAGNTYSKLYKFPRQTVNGVATSEGFFECEMLAKSPVNYPKATNEDRQLRLHTCFPACRRGTFDDVLPYQGTDPRPACVDNNFFDLLCVSVEEEEDHMEGVGETCLGADGTACFSWVWVVLALLIGNPIQIVAEFCIYEARDVPPPDPADIKDDEEESVDCADSCIKTSVEFGLILTLAFSILLTIGAIDVASPVNRVSTIFVTYILTLIVDQLKSIPVQIGLWWVVTLRFGTMEPGIQQYNEEFLAQFDAEDSLLTLIRKLVQMYMERPAVAYAVIGLVILYSVFMLVDLVFSDLWSSNPGVVDALHIFDMTMLCLFTVEIVIKLFAYWTVFLFDLWNLMDMIVVVVSLVLGFLLQGSTKNLGMLRILRLVRVVMVIRKVQEGRKRLKTIMYQSNNGGLEVSSQLQKVLTVLNSFQGNKEIPPYIRDELLWAENIIIGQRLYDVTLEDESGNPSLDEDLVAWVPPPVNFAQQNALSILNQTVTMTMGATMKGFSKSNISSSQVGSMADSSRNKSFSSTLAGSTQNGGVAASFAPGGGLGGMAGKPAGLSGQATKKRSSRTKEGKTGNHELVQKMFTTSKIRGFEDNEADVDNALQNLDSWSFDITAAGVPTRNMLRCTFVYVVAKYNTVRKFNLDFDRLFNFITKVEESHTLPDSSGNKRVSFHNSDHAIMTLQAVHLLITKCGLNRCIGSFESFLLVLASSIINIGHPGVSNGFLVATRHPLALRYNDRAVLENFSLSIGLKLMTQTEDCNFWGDFAMAMPTIRTVIVQMILSMETNQLTGNLQMFRTKLQSGDFPDSSNPGDRLVLMSCALRAADLSWVARPLTTFTKMAGFFMEELFTQGDFEKKLGLSVSPFCDRELCNQSKCLLGFIEVAAHPVLATFFSALPETSSGKGIQKEIMEDGIEGNKRSLITKIDDK